MLARMATLRDVMTKEVLSVAPEDTIGEAAEKMTNQGVGAVVVSDFGRMIGIFAERDLMRAVAGRVHSSEARVREWMTPDPAPMTEDASVAEAGETMGVPERRAELEDPETGSRLTVPFEEVSDPPTAGDLTRDR